MRHLITVLLVLTVSIAATAATGADENPTCDYASKETRPLTIAALTKHIKKRLLEDLQNKGLQLVDKSLIADIQVNDRWYMTIKVTLELTTGSHLTAEGFYNNVGAYTYADEWKPDGSAVNARCVFFTSKWSRTEDTRLDFKHSKTGKIVSTVMMDPVVIYSIN
jgi:hypothetical protein